MEIREEQSQDVAVIRKLTEAAFQDVPFSDQTEGAIVDRLRKDHALSLSLVAIQETTVVGHIAFSKVKIDGKHSGWFGLGPVSVWPDQQKRGIGSALIHEGILRLKAMGAAGCVLLGDPNYYRRFGFEPDPKLKYPGAPAEYFQSLVFQPPAPQGEVTYHPAFDPDQSQR